MAESKILIVTGMHRSGTSLIAHYLSQCGLNIGENLFNPHINKPENSCAGHHEDLDFIDFHKQVFQRNKIDSSALLLDGSELPIEVNAAEREMAKELLQSRDDLAQWAWKDPRTTLFLNFWDELIGDANYLFPFRHPLSVVDSLLRRGNEKPISRKPIVGLLSWTIYNQQILNFVDQKAASSLIFNIDDLIKSSDALLTYLETMGIELKPARLEDIFSKNALHHQLSDKVQAMADKYPREVSKAEDVYRKLQSLSKTPAST